KRFEAAIADRLRIACRVRSDIGAHVARQQPAATRGQAGKQKRCCEPNSESEIGASQRPLCSEPPQPHYMHPDRRYLERHEPVVEVAELPLNARSGRIFFTRRYSDGPSFTKHCGECNGIENSKRLFWHLSTNLQGFCGCCEPVVCDS